MRTQKDVVVLAHAALAESGAGFQSSTDEPTPAWKLDSEPGFYRRMLTARGRVLKPYQRFLGTDVFIPLTSQQKAFIAGTDVLDLPNLATITAGSAFFVATNSNSAYGPGLAGFGRNLGYSLSLDAEGEFLGTFLIPSLVHQDPRYFRMPHAPLPKRLVHAISHTVVGQSDSGKPMLNFATLLTYPIGAEIANLYIPGLQTNGRSTALRIGTSLALDPADALLTEFLPDVSKRIHIRILFVQQIINNLNTGSPPF